MSDGTSIPVLAGLAVGIAFVMAFALSFPASSLSNSKFHVDLTIDGLKTKYTVDEPIIFAVNATGYVNALCSNDYPNIDFIRENDSQLVRNISIDFAMSVCDSDPHWIRLRWIYNQTNDTHFNGPQSLQTTSLSQEGMYMMKVSFKDETMQKRFEVVDTDERELAHQPYSFTQDNSGNELNEGVYK